MATPILQKATSTTQALFPRPKISDPENYVTYIVISSAVEEAQREHICFAPMYNDNIWKYSCTCLLEIYKQTIITYDESKIDIYS